MKQIILILITLIPLFSFLSCDDPAGPVGQGYDRKAMLEFTAKNTIIPLYGDMYQAVKSHDSTLQLFAENQNEQYAQELRNRWRMMAEAWQYVVMFDFGPAQMSDGSLFQNIGTFPASGLKIESFINAKDTSFRNFDRDSRGLYALEYVIFKDSASFIQSINNQPFKLAYAKAVSRNILSRVETVLGQWQGAYGTSFINNDGAQAGSFVFHFEVMKNYNLGLPMGKRAGQVNSEPSKVEGYYSGYSTALLKAKYTALRHLWFGYARLSLATSLSANGFKEYILSVENGPRLAQDTELQWNVIGTGISTIDAQVPLHTMIIGQSSQLEQIFLEMTKHTRFIKSEMSSLLGISITYASGDGD
ncbi:MAG: imelysin family protein [Ignavibacteriae bacterium]|nr:imelysin family protein [Ignavibacteriota bacterium]